MHKAICAECGDECEVPFRPTGDKPVYCKNCFSRDKGFKPKKTDEYKQEFERLHAKLDKIIKALEAVGLKKEAAIVRTLPELKNEKGFPMKAKIEKKEVQKKPPQKKKLEKSKKKSK